MQWSMNLAIKCKSQQSNNSGTERIARSQTAANGNPPIPSSVNSLLDSNVADEAVMDITAVMKHSEMLNDMSRDISQDYDNQLNRINGKLQIIVKP